MNMSRFISNSFNCVGSFLAPLSQSVSGDDCMVNRAKQGDWRLLIFWSLPIRGFILLPLWMEWIWFVSGCRPIIKNVSDGWRLPLLLLPLWKQGRLKRWRASCCKFFIHFLSAAVGGFYSSFAIGCDNTDTLLHVESLRVIRKSTLTFSVGARLHFKLSGLVGRECFIRNNIMKRFL